jgi:SAM-dependent methyltransferase
MSTSPSFDPTVGYYNAHAARYAADTLSLDMQGLYEPFLALVPPGGHILDAGCGSGRDSLAFLRRGYRVTAFDASAEMARLAGERTGRPVAVLRFQDVAYEDHFDGIWACASLLHVPRGQIGNVFAGLTRALRPGDVWYMSFKAGEAEGVRDGRFFSDYTEQSLRGVIAQEPSLEVIRLWATRDVRPSRQGDCWINALVRAGKGNRPEAASLPGCEPDRGRRDGPVDP